MNAITIILVFVIVWWIVFFMTLPFGIKAPERVEPGHVPSAPDKPRVLLKAAITTGRGVRAWAYEYGSGLELTPIASGDWFVR